MALYGWDLVGAHFAGRTHDSTAQRCRTFGHNVHFGAGRDGERKRWNVLMILLQLVMGLGRVRGWGLMAA